KHFGSSLLNKVSEKADSQAAIANGKADPNKILKEPDLAKRTQMIRDLDIGGEAKAFTVEDGLNVANMAGSWMNSPARKTRNMPDMLDSVVMDLTLHELGHVLGLGHQFKENIIPEEGTVPSRYIKDLSAKANEENGWTNYTSVMGYRSGRTEM